MPVRSLARLPRLALALALTLPVAHPTLALSVLPREATDGATQCEGLFEKLRAREAEPPRLTVAQTAPPAAPKPEPRSEADLVAALSDMLQACSYDGSAISVSARSLQGASSSDGEAVVKAIMRFTGLPQNFKVMEGPVPNAAALIVLGPDELPMRVIAYNVDFLEQVRHATENNDWASMSIMAHEIGHHLSGHTLMPGGSQPPIELEADKFSGFVLQKMGASLADAQKAISTLVPVEDGPTHPGRARRLDAILDGWSEACAQQDDGPCAVEVAVAEPVATVEAPVVTEAPVEAEALLPEDLAGLSRTQLEEKLVTAIAELGNPKADIDAVSRQIEALNAALAGAVDEPVSSIKPIELAPGAVLDRLPRLDAATTPSKFDRFVYDELGLFDPAIKEGLARAAYDFAETSSIEIVTIIAADLQGRSAQQYALDAMRQLRVGKLDVGNGAVLVIAPELNAAGVALGAGLLVEYQDTAYLDGALKRILEWLDWGGQPRAAGELIADVADNIMRDTRLQDWHIRFKSLEEMLTAAETAEADLQRAGQPYDPASDPTLNRLLRLRGTIVSLTPDRADGALDINEVSERIVGPAMHVRTEAGRDVIVYVNPNAAALMPVPLEAGRTYAFVARENFLDADTPQVDLVSYDLVADLP